MFLKGDRLLFVVIFSFVHAVTAESVYEELSIPMPKVEIKKKDTYMCLASSVKDIDKDVVGYSISAIKHKIHHVVWAICEGVNSNTTLWDCRSQQGHICYGHAVTFGGWDGWSQTHDVDMLGHDIGVRIGEAARLNTVVFQVHFKEPTPKVELQASNYANLTLILSDKRHPWTMQRYLTSSDGYIPAETVGFSSETACVWKKLPVIAFRYAIHTHNYGKLVEAYVIRNGTAKLIGRGKPHGKRHDKYPVIGGQANIYPGDVIATRCLYDNKGPEPVKFGMTGSDEMCNFDLEFKYRTEDALVFLNTTRCRQSAQTSWWADVFPNNQ